MSQNHFLNLTRWLVADDFSSSLLVACWEEGMLKLLGLCGLSNREGLLELSP